VALRRFNLEEDLGSLTEWYAARDRRPVAAEDFPQIGFIEPGVAAGFLFRTDSSIAFADLFISNPKASTLTSARAVYAIMERLAVEAEACGFKYVAGLVSAPGTKKLCERQGFEKAGVYEMLLKETSA
jgi:hypothetical protein